MNACGWPRSTFYYSSSNRKRIHNGEVFQCRDFAQRLVGADKAIHTAPLAEIESYAQLQRIKGPKAARGGMAVYEPLGVPS